MRWIFFMVDILHFHILNQQNIWLYGNCKDALFFVAPHCFLAFMAAYYYLWEGTFTTGTLIIIISTNLPWAHNYWKQWPLWTEYSFCLTIYVFIILGWTQHFFCFSGNYKIWFDFLFFIFVLHLPFCNGDLQLMFFWPHTLYM